MTISGRNRVFGACVALEALMVLFCAVGIPLLTAAQGGKLPALDVTPLFRWQARIFSFKSPITLNEFVSVFFAITAFGLGAWLMRLFRKINSPEMLVFAIFICSLSFEALRFLNGWVEARGAADVLALALSRVILFSRWVGLLSLVIASLYASGLEYENTGGVIGLIVFLALIIACLVPLNSDILLPFFVLKPGFIPVLMLVWISFSAISVLCYFSASFIKNSLDSLKIGFALILILVSRDALFWQTDAALGAAAALALVVSCLWVIRVSFRRSLW
jgi:hypothetical protein